MKPEVWGPGAWIFLHSITLNYPDIPSEQDKRNYIDFFTSVSSILPCEKCQDHYYQYLVDYPIQNSLDKKQDLVIWLNNLHNKINKKNGKPEMDILQMMSLYKKMYSNKNNKNNYFFYCLIIILIIFIILLFGGFI